MSEQTSEQALWEAVKDVHVAFAKKARRDALKSVRLALESCDDVADVLPRQRGLQVAMMNGAILRVEVL